MNMSIDLSGWKIDEAEEVAFNAAARALFEIAGELLRLSSFEVPHDKGVLQSTGSVRQTKENGEPVAIVGYNTPYAARLHEHPEYRFQKGRKGKFLEDPAKRNLALFNRLANKIYRENL